MWHLWVHPCAFAGFTSCLSHSRLTDSMCASTSELMCVFVHVPAPRYSVCVLPLARLTPHLLVSSQQAPPLSHHSACPSGALKQSRTPVIIAGCGRPRLQSAATAAAMSHAQSVSVCVSVCLWDKERVSKERMRWRGRGTEWVQTEWWRESHCNHGDHSDMAVSLGAASDGVVIFSLPDFWYPKPVT